MAMKGRNMMGGRNPKRKKAIDEALGEAMSGGMESSPRPRARPKAPMKRPMATSPRPRMRPEAEIDVSPNAEKGDIELMMQEKMNRGDGMNMAYGGKVKKMKAGGKVRGAGIAQKGVRPCKMT
jgi:hypothetical protein